MDLDKVTYLLALADTRNYSRAAEQCHISQPALTRYIKNLEEELNVTLFDRSSFSHPAYLCRGAIYRRSFENPGNERKTG